MTSPDLPCECCGTQRYLFVATKRKYRIFQCDSCKLFLVFPQPSDQQLVNIYTKASGYFATSEIDLSKTSPAAAEYLHKLLLSKGVRIGKLLDVGCASGQLIFHMKSLGWNVSGVEFNPDAVKIAKENQINVIQGELLNGLFDERSFDVIILGDFIEHVKSPKKILKVSKDLLEKNGIIFINTPNARSGFAISSLLVSKLFNLPWAHSEAPYHLYEFQSETLSNLLCNLGFEVIHLGYKGRNSFLYILGATGYFDELKSSMKKTGKYKLNKRFIRSLPLLFCVSILLLPFYFFGRIYDLLSKSDAKFHVIARKK